MVRIYDQTLTEKVLTFLVENAKRDRTWQGSYNTLSKAIGYPMWSVRYQIGYLIANRKIELVCRGIGRTLTKFKIIDDVPPIKAKRGRKRLYPDEMIRDIVIMRNQGFTYEEIGQRYGISRLAASRQIQRYGGENETR